MKKDIVEIGKMSYDEKYCLLRSAVKKGITMELRKSTLSPYYHVNVVCPSYSGKTFLFRFFAERYFDSVVKKYDLKDDD